MRQPRVQPIPCAEIDRGHAYPLPPIFAIVSIADRLGPFRFEVICYALSITDVHEEVVITITRFEFGHGIQVPAQ